MEQFDKFEEIMTIRLFTEVREKMKIARKHCKDNLGFRKYENENHQIRCYIQLGIRKDLDKLQVKSGRPKKRK